MCICISNLFFLYIINTATNILVDFPPFFLSCFVFTKLKLNLVFCNLWLLENDFNDCEMFYPIDIP